jgi:hypothetical protein
VNNIYPLKSHSQGNHQERETMKLPWDLSGLFVLIDQVIVIYILFADLNKFYKLQANTER